MNNDQFPFQKEYDWANRKQIGQGGFARVFLVRGKKKQEEFAVKQIDMSKFDEDFKLDALKSEIKAMKDLSSEHTVKMYDCQTGPKFTYMVMELCSSDLKKELDTRGKYGEDESIHALDEILEGFKVLLDKGYIHRDIKPENILVKGDRFKIADYGFSKKLKKVEKDKLNEVCGSPFYMSPQLLYNMQYTSKCDIWSLGLMFYEMIFGFSPWATRQFEVYKRAVISRPVAFPYNCGIGSNVRDFIVSCLQVDEAKRISWEQLFKHPLVTELEKGSPIKHTQVSKSVQQILIRVQQSSSRKFINLEELFQKYEVKYKNMNKEVFDQFLRQIDPQITTFEAKSIFMAADESKDGLVSPDEFREFFLDVDYRSMDDIASRRIEEIVKMAQAKQLNIQEFFNLFDQDKSGDIDMKEFYRFIHYIAPAYPDHEVKQMWLRLDSNKSGTISKTQFVNEMTRSVPMANQGSGVMLGSRIMQNNQRAKRNISCLRDFMKGYGLTSQKMFEKMKLSPKEPMRIQEFGNLIRTINYTVSDVEISDMFKYLDRNSSASIELSQFKQAMSV